MYLSTPLYPIFNEFCDLSHLIFLINKELNESKREFNSCSEPLDCQIFHLKHQFE